MGISWDIIQGNDPQTWIQQSWSCLGRHMEWMGYGHSNSWQWHIRGWLKNKERDERYVLRGTSRCRRFWCENAGTWILTHSQHAMFRITRGTLWVYLGLINYFNFHHFLSFLNPFSVNIASRRLETKSESDNQVDVSVRQEGSRYIPCSIATLFGWQTYANILDTDNLQGNLRYYMKSSMMTIQWFMLTANKKDNLQPKHQVTPHPSSPAASTKGHWWWRALRLGRKCMQLAGSSSAKRNFLMIQYSIVYIDK